MMYWRGVWLQSCFVGWAHIEEQERGKDGDIFMLVHSLTILRIGEAFGLTSKLL
jgi:hypothetical protein